MRRHLLFLTRKFVRHQSFAVGMFNSKVNKQQLFPYPTHVFEGQQSENVQSAIEQIRNNDKQLNTGGLQIALQYGGFGLSYTGHALVCQELGSSCDSSLLINIEHCGLASYFLNTFGSRQLKGKYLTCMSDAVVKMGWAVLENNGCDISMNSTQAVLQDDKYVIRGQKYCAFANSRTHYLVLAKVNTQVYTQDGPKQTKRNSMFVVEKTSPCVVVDGNCVKFDGAHASDVVGVVGEGYKDAMITISMGQHVYASILLGSLKRAVQQLRDLVKDRWLTSTTASCACFLYAMQSALYALTANYDKPTQDSFIQTALTCTFIQQCANELLSTLSCLLPPTTCSTTVFDACLKNSRLLLSLMQSTDLLKAEAVCCGVEDYGLFFQRTSTVQVMQLRTARSLGMIDHIPVSSIDCSLIDKAIVNFGNAVQSTFVRNTSAVPTQQLLINRLGKAASLLYAAAAVASRVAMCASKKVSTIETQMNLAKIFIGYATSKANQLSQQCINVGLTTDDLYKRIALEICEDALQQDMC